MQIGNDSWCLPRAVGRNPIILAPAERQDVIIDFSDALGTVFPENILEQDDGRGPKGNRDRRKTERPGFPLIKFTVDNLPGRDCPICPWGRDSTSHSHPEPRAPKEIRFQ